MVLSPDIPVIVLQLPIIVSIIALMRYIVGFKTWKNYPTLALTFAFYLMYQVVGNAILALLYWIVPLVLIIGVAIATRQLIRRLKINHYARVAIMYLAATIASLVLLSIALQTTIKPIVAQPLFGLAIVLIGTTIDELATLLFKKDMQEFLRRFITTVVIGLLSGLLLTWSWWNAFLGRHHEVLLVVLVVDVIVAFWTAIRFTEILRFGSIIRNQK